MLTKTIVARHQLATAIDLYLAGGDLVSIYSLASNAQEILSQLCERAGIDGLSSQTSSHLPMGKSLLYDYINHPHRNFFKHADRDPNATVEPLRVGDVEGIIMLATEDYLALCHRAPIQLQVYQAWYLAKSPEKLNSAVSDELRLSLESIFPGLSDLPYEEQLSAGMNAIIAEAMNLETISDSRTEPAFS